jgi:cytochrome c peroxidase
MIRYTQILSLACLTLLVGCGDALDTASTDEPAVDGKADRIDSRDDERSEADVVLRELIANANVGPLDTGEVLPMEHPKVELGQALFFDRVLSGNEDVACATCHHPEFGTSDALPLPVGVGGDGLGPGRELGEERTFIPRNSPEIFNRGATAWTTMFWDNRVSEGEARFYTPAGDDLPDGLDSVLAAQAMFPPTSAEEMRGDTGENEIGDLEELPAIWAALTERVLGYPEYREMFAAAYPDLALDDAGFEHIANAIAAFEVAAFTKADTPFDRYLAGDDDALDGAQRRGAMLFFGDANCSNCHNGALLTDQKAHVIAVPQLGPGKGEDAPLDVGRMLVTGDDSDRYAFRTPPLRNVELTAPYMHAGSYTTLREAIEHHLDPGATVNEYDAKQLPADVRVTMVTDPDFIEDCMSRVSPKLAPDRPLSDAEVDDLVAFLEALTDPSARDMSDTIPEGVPSGHPVDGRPEPGSR